MDDILEIKRLDELREVVGDVSMSLPFHGWLERHGRDGHVRCS